MYRRFTRRYTVSKVHTLLKEKNVLKQIFDNIPDQIYFKDKKSRFILANKQSSDILGENDPELLIGKTDFDYYEEKYAQVYYEDEQRIMKEEKPMFSKEEKSINQKGDEIYISTSKVPIKDAHNNVIGIIGIGRDITMQKEAEKELLDKTESLKETNILLEERQEEIQQMAEELNTQAEQLKNINTELEKLSLVASKTENVVVIMDNNGNFEWVNNGFEKRYGIKMNAYCEKFGRNLRENSSNDSISIIMNQIYISKKPFTYTSKFTNKNGHEYWNQTNITPIINSNNEITNLILIDSDITELKKAELLINAQKTEIEKQTFELRKTNATKDRLFSIIAHDLKNPFHSILGFTDLLQKKYKNIEREKLNELLTMIHDSTTSAYHLLENLLEWARTQTNNVPYKPIMIDVHEIVDEIIALLSLHAVNKNITLTNETEKNIVVYADRNMLNTVIRNISSNAIKFTNEGGNIKFSATENNEIVNINITDNGIGIPEEKLRNLFNLDNVSSSAGTSGESGTGLGLIVCAEFMEINKGEIIAISKPGMGSTFTLSLPCKSIE